MRIQKVLARHWKKLFSKEFERQLRSVTNPHGDGGAADKILEIIKDFPIDNLVKKEFFDLPK